MSVSDHMYRTAKWKARIVTCDPSTGRIEAAMGDGAIRQIGASGIDSAFRWPIEGEVWTIRQENNNWVLGERWPDDTEVFLTTNMQPGEVRLDSDMIFDSAGSKIATNKNEDWRSIALGNFSNPLWYYKDTVGTVHFRGEPLGASSSSPPFVGEVLATLPQGYRPGNFQWFPVFRTDGGGTMWSLVMMGPDGTLTNLSLLVTSAPYSFGLVSFRAEN